MAKQLMLYENIVQITQNRHADWFVQVGESYAFSREVNSVPLVGSELAPASLEYPIVFTGNSEGIMPTAILGLNHHENLYLDRQDHWQANYVPGFIRRYPFIFSAVDGSQNFILCMDDAFPGFNREGRGERLIDDAGKPTAYLQNTVSFLQAYQAEFKQTLAFGQKLRELQLLDPVQAEIKLASGQTVSLSGFLGVNRDKLKSLSGGVLSDLAQSNALEWAYLQVNSMRNFEQMAKRSTFPAT